MPRGLSRRTSRKGRYPAEQGSPLSNPFEIAPQPCCIPSRARQTQLEFSRAAASSRERVTSGSVDGMVHLDGGRFLMGTESAERFSADGEGPVRAVTLTGFYMDVNPVSNAQFSEFVKATGYETDAERFGWSFVFQAHVPKELVEDRVLGVDWWCKISGAAWNRPEGRDSGIDSRLDYPAVHTSWNDAAEYARWAGKRLPTEAEWEYASRGGLEQRTFPWGDELTPEGRHLCNVWQGDFPHHDTGEDGWTAVAPADAFPANGYGLFGVTGNAWEWCADWFHPKWHVTATRVNPIGPPEGKSRVMKGGSWLCHQSYCNRYRVAARTSNTPDSSTTNISFRCVRDQ
ncbi:MAG: formylglycine-generating enzyme family protein [Bryobacteraceae bacterium]|nr:formylglycine-generating enzyme family protein [Bryobacteraceae bacterium]